MSTVYCISNSNPQQISLIPSNPLPLGYTSLVVANIADKNILYAFNSSTSLTDIYQLDDSNKSPILINHGVHDLKGYPWTILRFFILGNKPYLLSYEPAHGHLAFYEIKDDYTLSKPYVFMNQRSWPTQGFTEVSPIVIVGQLYVLCYDFKKGTVAIFSLSVINSSPPYAADLPPLNMLNTWYHQWAKGWDNFAFFMLGQSNFFFKINKDKLNVNIDHILDNPVMGSVEIGSYLQNLLPNALSVTQAATIPWQDGEPYIVTYDGTMHVLDIYRIHADCQGWTKTTSTQVSATNHIVTFASKNSSYILIY